MSNDKPAEIAGKSEFLLLLAFLAIGLVHALTYVYIVPPWQHYDEPNHFEAAWLTAILGRFPVAEEADPDFSRLVVQSMIENGFFNGLPNTPDLSTEENVQIPGYDQFGEQPLYYYLISLPLKVFQSQEITTALRSVRLVSVLFFLITILLAWDTVRLLTPPGHPLRWMVPATLALLPSFTDLMTAVNNDALSVVAFSFFFWTAVRVLQNGYKPLNISLMVLSLGIVYFSKNTAYVAFLLAPIVLIVAIYPVNLRKYVWPVLFAIILAAFLISLRWDDASFWHRTTLQSEPMRQTSSQAPHGDHVLALKVNEATHPFWAPSAYQLIPLSKNELVKEDLLTFGVWMWADTPVSVNMPGVNSPGHSSTKIVDVSEEPRFFSIQIPVIRPLRQMWISFDSVIPDQQENRLYYDGFVLAGGEFPESEAPKFNGLDDAHGEWDGIPFKNLIRNGSVEKRWPRFETQLDRLGTRILPDGILPTLALNAAIDFSGTRHVIRMMGWHQLRTFWAAFGWGHVPLAWPSVYYLLAAVTLLAVLGSIGMVIYKRRSLIWDQVWITVSATLFVFFAYWSRAIAYYEPGDFYFAPARHIYPAIIPQLTIICFGFIGIYKFLEFLTRKFRPSLFVEKQTSNGSGSVFNLSIPALFYWAMLLYLAVAGIISVIEYY